MRGFRAFKKEPEPGPWRPQQSWGNLNRIYRHGPISANASADKGLDAVALVSQPHFGLRFKPQVFRGASN
jgi:hypothetical protein